MIEPHASDADSRQQPQASAGRQVGADIVRAAVLLPVSLAEFSAALAGGRPPPARGLAHAGMGIVLGTLSLLPVGLEVFFVVLGVLYGVIDQGPYGSAWGGPTRAGAWLAHFGIGQSLCVDRWSQARLGDADAAGVEVDVGEPDPDEFGDADAGVEQGFDQDDVAGAAGFPHGVVERSDFGFGGHVGQLLRRAGNFGAQFLAQVPEYFLRSRTALQPPRGPGDPGQDPSPPPARLDPLADRHPPDRASRVQETGHHSGADGSLPAPRVGPVAG